MYTRARAREREAERRERERETWAGVEESELLIESFTCTLASGVNV